MKKFLLFFVFAFLISCGQSSEPTVPQTEAENKTISSTVGEIISSNPSYNQCIAQATQQCGENFIRTYSETNSSTDICQQFGDEYLRTACVEMVITETAKKTLDSDRCDGLKDSEKQAICKQNIVMARAVKNSDPTVCSNYVLTSTDVDSLENMKDRCVMYVIDQLEPTEKTKGMCGLLINEELKISCETRIQDVLDIQKNQPSETPVE